MALPPSVPCFLPHRLLLLCMAVLVLAAPAAAQDTSRIADAIRHLEWRPIGPANMGGRVTDIAGIPGDHKIFYVAGADGGLFRTTNAGCTFDVLFTDQAYYSVGAIAIALSTAVTRGSTSASTAPSGSSGSRSIHAIPTWRMSAPWAGSGDRTRTGASSRRVTVEAHGSRSSTSTRTPDAPTSRWISRTRGYSLPACGRSAAARGGSMMAAGRPLSIAARTAGPGGRS